MPDTFKTLLPYIHYGILLTFGVFVSSAFSGVTLKKKNIVILSCVSAVIIIVQTVSNYLIGYDNTEKLYPLISHLPLVLLLSLYFRRKISSSLFAVSSAYLCCQISKWLGLLFFQFFGSNTLMWLIRIIVNITMGILLIRFIAPLTTSILSKPVKSVLIFSILPIVYYAFDYIATVYTDLLYRGDMLVYEFLPFSFAVSYLIFCILYFKEYEQKNELERQKQIIEIQAAQSAKEIDAIRSSSYETAILRHDMRHHLQSIYSLVENGSDENALNYIRETMFQVDSAAVNRFCENELVNLILSYYKAKAEKLGIRFDVSVKTEKQLPCPEQEFSSILSNGLENAINAASELEPNERFITINIKSENKKLLLSVRNPYKTAPILSDGIPVSPRPGHGFGTQSIILVTRKLNGNCQFTAENNIFSLRVVM